MMNVSKNLLLLAGACLGYMIPMTWSMYALVVWISPILLLMYVYREKNMRAIIIGFCSLSISTTISIYGVIPNGLGVTLVTAIVGSLLVMLLLILNKWVVTVIRHPLSLLFFPTLMTGYDYINSFSTFGIFQSSANSQLLFLSLAQLASISGIWGIVFLNYLIASIISFTLKEGIILGIGKHKKSLITGLIVMIVVLGLGGLSLNKPQGNQSVLASGITPSRVLWDDAIQTIITEWDKKTGFYERLSTSVDFRASIEQINRDLLVRTEQAQVAGSKIISWSEGAAIVFEDDEKQFLELTQRIANNNKSVLVATYILIKKASSEGPVKMENKAVIINEKGELISEYNKFSLVAGEERMFNKGEDKIPVVDTIWGRIAVAICFDADFPQRILAAGQQNPDFLIIPSSDWSSITPYHTKMSAFRAIENKLTVLRITHSGMSAAYNSKGQLLAQKDDFDAQIGTTISHKLPIEQDKATIYKVLGDLLPILCLIFTLCFLCITIIIRKSKVYWNKLETTLR